MAALAETFWSVIMSNDEFVEVPGYPGYYANRSGQIKDKDGKILRYMRSGKNGVVVQVRPESGNIVNTPVKKLVARTFLVEWTPGSYVTQIDDSDPLNFRVDNLQVRSRGVGLKAFRDRKKLETITERDEFEYGGFRIVEYTSNNPITVTDTDADNIASTKLNGNYVKTFYYRLS